MELRVLGPLELVGDDGPIRLGAAKQRQLLAALTIGSGQARDRDRLVDLLWGATAPATAAKLVQVYVSQLRKALPAPARIGKEAAGYVLELPPGVLDAERFEGLLAEGRAALAAGNAALAVSLLSRGLDLWRGPAFADLAFDDFVRVEAERLDELRLAATEERIAGELVLGRHAELVAELQTLAAAHPLRERLQAQAMLALYRSGRQSDALKRYAATRLHLRDELGLEPGSELKELQQRILQHDPGLAAVAAAGASPGVLPSAPNRLLGRERDLAEVRGLLLRDDVRLLALTGAGGSGKTRLALEVARAAASSFANGAVFVGLAPIRDPELVPAALARALGIEEEGGQDTVETLASALAQLELLVLVDNAEHVRAALPLLVGLLARAPRVKVLVTSRVVLHLTGEHVYPVEPLSEDSAVALFSARAREAEPRFTSGVEDEEAIRIVCRRLDGLPLAVELAAGCVRALTPVELAAMLVSRLPVLTAGPRDLPARQQTLEATLAWSYDLLGDDEKGDLRRLAVFASGFTIEAAEAVCNTPLARLVELVDHNLLTRATWAAGSRYSMLETIREFALDRLADRGEHDEVARAHAEYLLILAERAEKTAEASYAPGWLERLDAELDEFRVAVRWALDADEPLLALRTVTALTGLWTVRGAYREWRDWLTEALNASPDAPAALKALALRDLGAAHYFTGNHEQAIAVSEQALELFSELGDKKAVASMLDRLAAPAAMLGDRERARALADESLALFREIGDRSGALYPLSKVASDEWSRGDPKRGLALAEEALALARECGDTWLQAWLLQNLADMLRDDGEHERAAVTGRECVSLAHQLGDTRTLLFVLATLASFAAADGDALRAGRLWGAVESLEARGETKINDERRARYHGLVRTLAAAELEAAITEGRAMTVDQAVALALEAN